MKVFVFLSCLAILNDFCFCIFDNLYNNGSYAFHIFVGLAQIESMVGDKMAKKLIDSIGDILGTSKPKKEKQDEKETIMSIEEITLPSGEKKSRIIEGTQIGDDLIEIKTKDYVEKKEEGRTDTKNLMSDLTKQIKEVNDKMERMLGKSNAIDKTGIEDHPNEEPLSLDPRSDLSDER